MTEINPQYLFDAKGRKSRVVLTVREFNEMMEYAQDAMDAEEIERQKARGEKMIPWEEVKRQLKARKR